MEYGFYIMLKQPRFSYINMRLFNEHLNVPRSTFKLDDNFLLFETKEKQQQIVQ